MKKHEQVSMGMISGLFLLVLGSAQNALAAPSAPAILTEVFLKVGAQGIVQKSVPIQMAIDSESDLSGVGALTIYKATAVAALSQGAAEIPDAYLLSRTLVGSGDPVRMAQGLQISQLLMNYGLKSIAYKSLVTNLRTLVANDPNVAARVKGMGEFLAVSRTLLNKPNFEDPSFDGYAYMKLDHVLLGDDDANRSQLMRDLMWGYVKSSSVYAAKFKADEKKGVNTSSVAVKETIEGLIKVAESQQQWKWVPLSQVFTGERGQDSHGMPAELGRYVFAVSQAQKMRDAVLQNIALLAYVPLVNPDMLMKISEQLAEVMRAQGDQELRMSNAIQSGQAKLESVRLTDEAVVHVQKALDLASQPEYSTIVAALSASQKVDATLATLSAKKKAYDASLKACKTDACRNSLSVGLKASEVAYNAAWALLKDAGQSNDAALKYIQTGVSQTKVLQDQLAKSPVKQALDIESKAAKDCMTKAGQAKAKILKF